MLEQFTHNILEGIPILRTVTNGFIGASLSEPHIDELNVRNLSLSLYIYIQGMSSLRSLIPFTPA